MSGKKKKLTHHGVAWRLRIWRRLLKRVWSTPDAFRDAQRWQCCLGNHSKVVSLTCVRARRKERDVRGQIRGPFWFLICWLVWGPRIECQAPSLSVALRKARVRQAVAHIPWGCLVVECVVRAYLRMTGSTWVAVQLYSFAQPQLVSNPPPSSKVDNSKMVSAYNPITLALPDSQVYAHRVEFAPRQQRGLPEFWLKNSQKSTTVSALSSPTNYMTQLPPPYARLPHQQTDHWWSRACCIHLFPPCTLLQPTTGQRTLKTPAQQSSRFHNTLDEAYPARPGPWYLVQAARGGARTQGQLRPRCVCSRHECDWFGRWSRHQGTWLAGSRAGTLLMIVCVCLQELLAALNFESITVNVVQLPSAQPERPPRRERKVVPGAGRSWTYRIAVFPSDAHVLHTVSACLKICIYALWHLQGKIAIDLRGFGRIGEAGRVVVLIYRISLQMWRLSGCLDIITVCYTLSIVLSSTGIPFRSFWQSSCPWLK